MTGQIKVSHIWNLAWENKGIVKQHCFWEIRVGDQDRFWEDSWKREPIINKNELAALKRDTDNKGFLVVKDFWDLGRDKEKWRKS